MSKKPTKRVFILISGLAVLVVPLLFGAKFSVLYSAAIAIITLLVFFLSGRQKGHAAVQSAISPEQAKNERLETITTEGYDALREMGSLYHDIDEPEIRSRINEIMLITDKIIRDASEDPSDLPQIRRFFSYYLPTTLKLLSTYKSLNAVGIDGDNISASKKNIIEMLDTAITAYKKRLDSLFENQALDIETDIDVMNQMLEREGLSSGGSL